MIQLKPATKQSEHLKLLRNRQLNTCTRLLRLEKNSICLRSAQDLQQQGSSCCTLPNSYLLQNYFGPKINQTELST